MSETMNSSEIYTPCKVVSFCNWHMSTKWKERMANKRKYFLRLMDKSSTNTFLGPCWLVKRNTLLSSLVYFAYPRVRTAAMMSARSPINKFNIIAMYACTALYHYLYLDNMRKDVMYVHCNFILVTARQALENTCAMA